VGDTFVKKVRIGPFEIKSDASKALDDDIMNNMIVHLNKTRSDSGLKISLDDLSPKELADVAVSVN
jgi:hypothetical protein